MTQGEAMTPDTDDAAPDVVLAELARCAAHWKPEVRVMGNVRAGDIVRAISTLQSEERSLKKEVLDEFVRKVKSQRYSINVGSNDYVYGVRRGAAAVTATVDKVHDEMTRD